MPRAFGAYSYSDPSRRGIKSPAKLSVLATRSMGFANVDHSLATGLGSRRVHNAQRLIRDIPYTKSGTFPEKRDRSNSRRTYVYALKPRHVHIYEQCRRSRCPRVSLNGYAHGGACNALVDSAPSFLAHYGQTVSQSSA